MKKKYRYAPWWVNIICSSVEWIDKKICSRISYELVYLTDELLEKHCKCDKCLERRKNA